MVSEQADSIIHALRGSPALLAVIVLQMATLGMIYLVSSANSERVHLREMAFIEACGTK
jgi:hypothetical protein